MIIPLLLIFSLIYCFICHPDTFRIILIPYVIVLNKVYKNAEIINPKVSKSNNYKKMSLSKFPMCGSKKSRFMKEQEPKGIFSNLVLKTPLNKTPLLGDIFF